MRYAPAVKPHPQIPKTLKWTGAAATVLLLLAVVWVLTRPPAPWLVLKQSVVSRVQVFDVNGALKWDTASPEFVTPPSALTSVGKLLGDTEFYWSSVLSRTTTTTPAAEADSVLVEFDSRGQKHRLLVIQGGSSRLQSESDPVTYRFLAPRTAHVSDNIAIIVTGKPIQGH